MPSSGRTRRVLVDTSVAIALMIADHDHNEQTTRALRGKTLGLCGHAAFETFSVLTRLPPPARRTSASVGRLLARNFPESRFLGAPAATTLLSELATAGIAGGAVFEALVGAAAREHALPLATRDRRALDVYRALDIDVELLA